jgi:hypothetical protein
MFPEGDNASDLVQYPRSDRDPDGATGGAWQTPSINERKSVCTQGGRFPLESLNERSLSSSSAF